MKAKAIRYALALLALGVPLDAVVDRVVEMTGYPRDAVVEYAHSAIGRFDRDPLSVRTEYAGILVRNASVAVVEDAIANALCGELVDGGFGEGLACLAAEANYLTERLCLISNGTAVARSARTRLTLAQRNDVRDAVLALGLPGNQFRFVADANEAPWSSVLAEEGVVPCVSAGPG